MKPTVSVAQKRFFQKEIFFSKLEVRGEVFVFDKPYVFKLNRVNGTIFAQGQIRGLAIHVNAFSEEVCIARLIDAVYIAWTDSLESEGRYDFVNVKPVKKENYSFC